MTILGTFLVWTNWDNSRLPKKFFKNNNFLMTSMMVFVPSCWVPIVASWSNWMPSLHCCGHWAENIGNKRLEIFLVEREKKIGESNWSRWEKNLVSEKLWWRWEKENFADTEKKLLPHFFRIPKKYRWRLKAFLLKFFAKNLNNKLILFFILSYLKVSSTNYILNFVLR